MAVTAMGTPPPVPDNAPAVATSDHVAQFAAVRLNLKFRPAAQDGESAAGVTRLPADYVRSPDTLVLPPFVVTDVRVKLTERDVMTGKATLELARKKYLSPLYSATFGPLAQLAAYYLNWPSILGGWHPNEAEAMALYRQDERLRMLMEMDDLIRLEMIGEVQDQDTKPVLHMQDMKSVLRVQDTKEFQRIRFGAVILSR